MVVRVVCLKAVYAMQNVIYINAVLFVKNDTLDILCILKNKSKKQAVFARIHNKSITLR